MLTDLDLEKISHLFDRKFDAIDIRFDALEGRFDLLENRFDRFEIFVSNEFVRVNDRLDRIYRMETEDIAAAYESIEDHEKRITQLEKTTS